uniref:Uncharacterized protein MLCB1610.17 n=1 Tax=Mycobacterium leprae TaxID=1769 RepID=O32969_MYCLR|nr:hypothetical protein MLCB22.36c [Mycobacterium leprae]CAB36581.1 hypothetical protein MLCB596.25 [Mycobacterium leprae]CAB39587.1 hypothetical protein MLCB458.21c [Mycobacterium leprae]CAB43163.1 hypothetical protein MLCB1610.17 [Mycobacterium leprae]
MTTPTPQGHDMHTKTPLPRGANNYPHTHACIDIAFSTAQVPSPWHHQHVDQAASTTDMLTCAALIVSTAAKHTKPHRKQAVSHPPTKTPQHSKTRQQDSGLPPTTTEHIGQS